jgi:serine/threonine-protein kinase
MAIGRDKGRGGRWWRNPSYLLGVRRRATGACERRAERVDQRLAGPSGSPKDSTFDPMLQVGAHVTANIRLVRLLGQGGMGSIWLADHLGLHTQVVVKFVSAELADKPDIRERFEREAAFAAQAKSPHVVQVLDYGITAFGIPYIAMELLEGEDLGKRIARDGIIAPEVFAGWLTQACKGLGRAHAKGIVHRDIKPDNIFLCEIDGETVVKVLDFGIAKGTDGGAAAAFSGTKTDAFLGTAYYMSPEQTMGAKHIDLRTDLWSMAVTTYLALTATRPFESGSIGELVVAITSAPIAPPSTCNPRLGPSIDAWMTKALARPVDERFSSAKEMADAFAAAVAGAALRPSQVPTSMQYTAPLAPAPNVRASTSVGVVSERVGSTNTRPSPSSPSSASSLSRPSSASSASSLSRPSSPSKAGLVLAALGACLVLGVAAFGVRLTMAGRSVATVGAATGSAATVREPAGLTATLIPDQPPSASASASPAPLSAPSVASASPLAPPAPLVHAPRTPASARRSPAPVPPETNAPATENASAAAPKPATPPKHQASPDPATTSPNRLKMGLE